MTSHTPSNADRFPQGLGADVWKRLGLTLALAILIHLAVLPVPLKWSSKTQTPTEIVSISPSEVEKLRKSLKKEPSNIFIPRQELPKSKSPPSENDDARYISDRDIRVEKEQRARSGGVLPQDAQSQRAQKGRTKVPVWAPPHPNGIEVPQSESQQANDKTSEASEQAVLEDLPEGTETLLNARESVYYSFHLRIRESVGLLWQSLTREAVETLRLGAGDYRTIAEVIMDSNGDLLAVKILESSGYSLLDLAVEESWRRVKRFPNPPRGLIDDDGKIRLKWTFSVELGNGRLLFQPPQRLRRDDLFP